MTSMRQQKNHSKKQQAREVANSEVPYPNIITQVNKEDEKNSSGFEIMNMLKCCSMLWRCLPFRKQNFSQIEETATQGLLEPQLPQYQGRKTLVLDLDETLVHSTFEPVKNPDLILPVIIKGNTYKINVMIRPGTAEFLARMGELYEVVVFTASLAEYAEPLVKVLDPTNVVSYLLYRQHCTPVNGIYVKDLSLIGRDIKNVILVDNSPNSFLFQPENAYHIKNFFDDKTDRELDRLTYFLENITKLRDVRPIEEHRQRIEPHQPHHHAHQLKVVKISHDTAPDQDQEPDQEQEALEESSMVELDDVSIIQPEISSKQTMKKKDEKSYNVETEPDLRRDDREGEFPEVIVSERNKDRAGLYANYYNKGSKVVPLTERIQVNDRLIPQALDSSVDFELPSPKESDGLINHREADAFFDNNSNSSDSKESKNNARSKLIVPAFPKHKTAVFSGNNFVAVNDPSLEGHLVEDVRFLTGAENLNSPLGKQVKIDLATKME